MGYDYPAGPVLDQAGQDGNPKAVGFPRAKFEGQGYDFSFSGVKTAAAQDWEQRESGRKPRIDRADWIASFEAAVVDALCDNLFRAADDLSIHTVALAGGVARNRRWRRTVTEWAVRTQRTAIIPSPVLCADNAAMIAGVGLYQWRPGMGNARSVDAVPNWELGKPFPLLTRA
jgi:N6-L-threonylcarbamoyladenine synthase